MKRLVTFAFDPNGKWATLSGVLLGFAFFAQAVDYLLLHPFQALSTWKLLVMMVFPMVMEAVWCVSLRAVRANKAELFGVFGAVFCLILLLQAFFYHNILLVILFALLYLLSGAAMIFITWGFFGHRALGGLVFFVVGGLRILFVAIHRLNPAPDWQGILSDLPSVCILLAMVAFFGNLKKVETE